MADPQRAGGEIPIEVLDALARVTGAPDPRIGEIVGGRYRIARHLAEGGMGRVYVAEHVEIAGLAVAIKVLAVETTDEQSVKRFRREASAAAQLRSPHVVSVLDFGRTADGAFYLVMELLEGRDLASRTATEGLADVHAVLDVLRQIAAALDHAHARGIVHRDLKPENVMILEGESEGLVKVLDFGVAKSFLRGGGTVTDVGTVLGTPAFMAPEQALGQTEKIGPATDRYALAAVALELLTGHTPYPYDSAIRTVQALAEEAPRLPSALGVDVEGLDAVLARGMAREPRERFESAEAFVDALARVLERAVLEPTPTGRTPRTSFIRTLRPRKRRIDSSASTQAVIPGPPPPLPPELGPSSRIVPTARGERLGLVVAIVLGAFVLGWLAGALVGWP